jgi:hypothetical protein
VYLSLCLYNMLSDRTWKKLTKYYSEKKKVWIPAGMDLAPNCTPSGNELLTGKCLRFPSGLQISEGLVTL